jgi:hypothetical protein
MKGLITMNRIIINRTLVLILVLFACTSLSCDTGWTLSSMVPKKKNFVWTDEPTDPFLESEKGWYYSAGDRDYVVLGSRGVYIPGGPPFLEYVVLCLERNARAATFTEEYKLTKGFAVSIAIYGQEGVRLYFGSLDAEHFFSERVSKHKMHVAYNGRLLFIGSRLITGEIRKDWLRFDIVAKENKDKVVSIAKELHELLEQADVANFDDCFSEILNESQTKN